jgi:hypothetical protein
VEALLVLLSGSDALRRFWSRAATAGLVAGVIWLAVAGVGLSRAYFDTRYQSEAYRPAIDYLIGQARAADRHPARAVVFSDDATYARFYPYLHGDLRLRVVKTDRPTWSAELLGWTGQEPFWLWRGSDTDPDLESWLDQHACLDATKTFDQGTLFLLRPCSKP